MKNLITVFVLLMALTASAQEKGIQFEHDKTFSELKAMAKEQDKLIFMDCYTTWCGPCKYLAKNIFTLPEVGEFYNKNFINSKFDMEKGEGVDIAKEYSIRAYPTLIFINSEGELEHKKIGGGTAEDILNLGKNALDKENNFKAVSTRIKNKKHSASDIKNYLTFNKYGKDNSEVLDLYYKGLDSESYYTEETWAIIDLHLNDFESDFAKFLIKNRGEYESKIGKKQVDTKLEQILAQGIQQAKGDQVKIDKLKSIDAELVKGIMIKMDLSKAYGMLRRSSSDETKINEFKAAADKYVKSKQPAPDYINRFAWDIYEQFKKEEMGDKRILDTGLSLSTKMIELAPKNPMLLDTHAHLLFLAKDVKGAIKFQEKAISMLKKKGRDTGDYEKELKSFKEAL